MKKILSTLIPHLYGQWLNVIAIFSPTRAAKIGFQIFTTIRKGRVLPQQKSFLDAAKHSVETIKGHQVQAYSWPGTKPTVLLLHGWESNTHRWHKLIAKLREHQYHVLAFDAPAHGYSTGKKLHVPLYAEVLRHFINTHKPTFLIGHSMGGMTALYDHYLHPQTTVRKIVTIGSPCEFEGFMHHYQNLLKFNQRVWDAMDQGLKQWFGYHFTEFSSARFVAENTLPGLLFHDKLDKQVPYTASVKVHEHWKNSQLILTEGLGHSMHQDEVNEQIIGFLEAT
ncbi:Alpha/beta hydrolase fold protein [Croceitalea dokdonensis DOKDO 023]|uniref:Alpha/beta hydrolase fold protein n=1 Tax=Croceitalea dokdonensis DOKDO 023 TaxID=1300341 RepID=A0A0P7A4W9_9FLAO|nr:alpha/beta hydrolase [Croceitalea dokdonensis]KPM31470.1 Alpha/beta hydrolase fold protein [Croceitalea dokdonensis DOKDO 023]